MNQTQPHLRRNIIVISSSDSVKNFRKIGSFPLFVKLGVHQILSVALRFAMNTSSSADESNLAFNKEL